MEAVCVQEGGKAECVREVGRKGSLNSIFCAGDSLYSYIKTSVCAFEN